MLIKQLSFRHHENAPYFFKDISLELKPHKIHALHGKNGMGKTVLLNLLSGNAPPHSIVEGEIIGYEKAMLVNQRFDHMLADQFSFRDNLKFACMHTFPHPFAFLQQQPYFQPDFLKKFHIDESQPVKKLSGGQRQILALLMALQKKRTVLLLDEPTATLDQQNAAIVFEFLETLSHQDVTFLIVCHDQKLIDRYTSGSHFHIEINSDGERKVKETSKSF